MVTITLKGYITEAGQLKVDLPENHPVGEVTLIIAPIDDEAPWTDEEIEELLRPEPMTGAEIVAGGHVGGWEHKGITDGVEFVEEMRRKRKEKRQWRQD